MSKTETPAHCPFCGGPGKAITDVLHNSQARNSNVYRMLWVVQCTRCGSRAKPAAVMSAAIQEWNLRFDIDDGRKLDDEE